MINKADALLSSVGDAIIILAICFGIGGCYYIKSKADIQTLRMQMEYKQCIQGTNIVVEAKE